MGTTNFSLQNLTEHFRKLEGIGAKTAQKLAFHVINSKREDIIPLINALINTKENLKMCSSCGHFTEDELCEICSNEKRNKNIICVVQESSDLLAFERLKEFNGIYHVLHGAISPLDGITPDDLNIKSLLKKIEENENVEEVILATNPDTNGEATAMYLSRLLKPFGIKTSRLAYGLPAGATLEYADNITLSKAFNGRLNIE